MLETVTEERRAVSAGECEAGVGSLEEAWETLSPFISSLSSSENRERKVHTVDSHSPTPILTSVPSFGAQGT